MAPRIDERQRLANELTYHRRIATNAETIWNWNSPSGRRRATRRARYYIEVLKTAHQAWAMELGCGSGVFLQRTVAATGARIIALDLAIDLITKARSKLAKKDRVGFYCGNAEQLPFADQIFDVVYGSSILHHLDLEAALSEVHRVLRPGGRIIFAEPNLLNPQIALTFILLPRRWIGISPNEMAFTRFSVRRVLERVGFVEVSSEPYDFLHPIVPAALVGIVDRMSYLLERVPFLREIAGSQIIRARRP